MTDSRELAMPFDSAADVYQRRPEYLAEIFDAMLATTDLGVDDRLLEIGCVS